MIKECATVSEYCVHSMELVVLSFIRSSDRGTRTVAQRTHYLALLTL